ncbi:hypothetical protein E2562_032947 [Oryza meyeriana var. granulata]|uniref:Uncharacterized protein n=1 Tax=Oryza meyeriana var. granulata TaxID=110450 RepID=A0A6G1DR32_9ORYZ|nr:hypothetical protein E2562_032947 [Oryza meyeriana var. granulata]
MPRPLATLAEVVRARAFAAAVATIRLSAADLAESGRLPATPSCYILRFLAGDPSVAAASSAARGYAGHVPDEFDAFYCSRNSWRLPSEPTLSSEWVDLDPLHMSTWSWASTAPAAARYFGTASTAALLVAAGGVSSRYSAANPVWITCCCGARPPFTEYDSSWAPLTAAHFACASTASLFISVGVPPRYSMRVPRRPSSFACFGAWSICTEYDAPWPQLVAAGSLSASNASPVAAGGMRCCMLAAWDFPLCAKYDPPWALLAAGDFPWASTAARVSAGGTYSSYNMCCALRVYAEHHPAGNNSKVQTTDTLRFCSCTMISSLPYASRDSSLHFTGSTLAARLICASNHLPAARAPFPSITSPFPQRGMSTFTTRSDRLALPPIRGSSFQQRIVHKTIAGTDFEKGRENGHSSDVNKWMVQKAEGKEAEANPAVEEIPDKETEGKEAEANPAVEEIPDKETEKSDLRDAALKKRDTELRISKLETQVELMMKREALRDRLWEEQIKLIFEKMDRDTLKARVGMAFKVLSAWIDQFF